MPDTPVTDPQVAVGWQGPDELHGGGGFFPDQPAPDYQKSALAAYQSHYSDPVYSSIQSNRGFPDISAQSDVYPIQSGGSDLLAVGTSLASPIAAGLLALMDGALVAAGKPTLGNPKPLFYAHPELFHDVVNGSNFLPGGSSTSEGAWQAAEGWDPATGLGQSGYVVSARV